MYVTRSKPKVENRREALVGPECALITNVFPISAGRDTIANLRAESTPMLQLTSVNIFCSRYFSRMSRASAQPVVFIKSWIKL